MADNNHKRRRRRRRTTPEEAVQDAEVAKRVAQPRSGTARAMTQMAHCR
jgi:hypothetical protein